MPCNLTNYNKINIPYTLACPQIDCLMKLKFWMKVSSVHRTCKFYQDGECLFVYKNSLNCIFLILYINGMTMGLLVICITCGDWSNTDIIYTCIKSFTLYMLYSIPSTVSRINVTCTQVTIKSTQFFILSVYAI